MYDKECKLSLGLLVNFSAFTGIFIKFYHYSWFLVKSQELNSRDHLMSSSVISQKTIHTRTIAIEPSPKNDFTTVR